MFPSRRWAVVTAVAILTACQDQPAAPTLSKTIHLTVVGGDGQSGRVGEELLLPLVVKVLGTNGKGIRGQLLNFRVTVGGGRLFAGAALTDANGQAQDYWTLGGPGPQQVEVVAVDPTTGLKQNFGSFIATALAPATLTIAPSNANLGTVPVGGSGSPMIFTVSNVGDETSGAVTPSLGGPNAGDFAVGATTCSGPLGGGATCTVSVTFSPLVPGARTASLIVTATPGGSVSATLTGIGSQVATLSVSPPSFNYGSQLVNTSSTTASYIIQNTGSAAASALAATLGGSNPGDFVFGGNTCTGVTLMPGQTCNVGVQFRPTASGARTASLIVSASGGVSASSALSGTGVNPAQLAISPTSYQFAPRGIGNFGEAQTFTVTNTGQQVSGVVAISLTGMNSQDFSMPTNMCLLLSLQPGQSCQVIVGFQPTATGARTASLVATASPGGSASVTLSGTGFSTTPALVISPTSRSFGSVVLGATSSSHVFTINNGGGGTSGTLAINVVGTASSSYSMSNDTCTGVTLGAGASCTLSLSFSPTVPGTAAATLIANANPGGSVSSSLTGTGLPPATLAISPALFDFGFQPTGVPSRLQTFIISNTGGSPTGTLGTGLTGPHVAEYSVTRNTCAGASLVPNGSCQIDVVFTPIAAGTRQATLGVSGSPGGSVSALLTGNGS